jgi:putative tricarboxylic transport membrane protein
MTAATFHCRAALGALCAAALAACAPAALAQPGWRPDKPVEIVIPTAAAGINDHLARVIQKVLVESRLVDVPVLPVNKAGGNQVLATVYLAQHAGSPHHLLYATPTIFTNQISGVQTQRYTEFTPLALLFVESTVITVGAQSPIRDFRALLERLKADPESIAFGTVSRGGPNHLALSQAFRVAGIDPRRLRVVVFKTNAESMTAVAGGHIQAVMSSVSAALPQAQAGMTRMLVVTAPQRLPGPMAGVPTMREHGIEASIIANWRGVFGARAITAAQAAFWEEALARVAASDEWKKQLDASNLSPQFLRGPEFAKYLEAEYANTRAVIGELGLAKQ